MKRYHHQIDPLLRNSKPEDMEAVWQKALELRMEAVRALVNMFDHIMAAVDTLGGIGMIDLWAADVQCLDRDAVRLTEFTGRSLPSEALPVQPGDLNALRAPWKHSPTIYSQHPGNERYTGPGRVFVPTVRTLLDEGEELELKVILLGVESPQQATLEWRQLGEMTFLSIPLERVSGSVCRAVLTAEQIRGRDFEYYVRAPVGNIDATVWPVTAPEICQTVVVMNEKGVE